MKKMIMKIEEISTLQRGEFKIPNLNYTSEMPSLQRERFTTRALITNIKKHNNSNIIDFDYQDKNDIELIKYLQDSIQEKINKYLVTPDDSLLKSIFNSIQIWGGNSARMFYLKNGFEKNFDLKAYKDSILILRSGKENSLSEAIKLFKKIKYINIAYASKHFSFWTSDYKGFGDDNKKQLPILDRLINNLVYGKSSQPDYRHYEKYINDMKIISEQLQIDVNVIERTLFNYADANEGREWIRRRLFA
jgi:hypothetical protein